MEETITALFGGTMLIIIVLFVAYYLLIWKKVYNYHSHWSVLLEDFSFSSKEFYQLLSTDLRKKGIKSILFDRVNLREGNIFSRKRQYLRIYYKDFHFDLCASPFGSSFFISWWCIYKHSFLQILISLIPFIGHWLEHKLFTITYYKVDTATMFMTSTHLSVLEVLDSLTMEYGVRMLPESERKPELSDIFKR